MEIIDTYQQSQIMICVILYLYFSIMLRDISLLFIAIPILLLCSCGNATTTKTTPTQQVDSLRYKVATIAAQAQGTVGVAIKVLETGDTFSYNGEAHLPMQSTYKFPLAMYVLHQIDSGKLSLAQKVHISAKEMDQDTWSPMSDIYPDGNIDMPVDSLLNYIVTMSDNIACDMLFKAVGGTQKTEDYIHSLGVTSIAIQATEEAMHKDWPTQYTNWCEPTAMVQLLEVFYKKKALSDSSNALLWRLMVHNKTGDDRIRGLLPKGTIVGDKTGTGGTKDGITSATNDIGIIVLPNGNHLAIVVYVSDAKASVAVNKAVIAKIAKAAYDTYSLKNKN